MLQYITVAGAIINFLGSAPYIKDTLSGKTKPNRITFLMWSAAPLIGSAASISDGVTWAALPVLGCGLLPFTILIASFYNKNAEWKLRWYDYLCGFISVAALILWKVTHQPSVAVTLAIMSDAFAALPTLIKSWTNPETETASVYAAGVIGTATSYFAITIWKITEYAFPTYLIIADLLIFLVICSRRKQISKGSTLREPKLPTTKVG